jgi:Ni/Fe-hydrogenase subunit HybB-like protein
VLIIAGVLLSTLHQSSLGSLYLIVPEKLYPLWYSPLLPVYFFVSAIAVGCAMVIFESSLSSRVFKRGLEMHLLVDLAKGSAVVLAVFAVMRFMDLSDRKLLGLLFEPRYETWFFHGELFIGTIIPIVMFSMRRVRHSARGLMIGSLLVITGFILNRMNITVTGMEGWAGVTYIPSWMEFSVTIGIVVFGFVAFALAAKHLPIFVHGEEGHHSKFDLLSDLQSVSRAA